MATFSPNQRVRIKEDASSSPPPVYFRGKVGVISGGPSGPGWGGDAGPNVPVYKVKFERDSHWEADMQDEDEFGEDWLETTD